MRFLILLGAALASAGAAQQVAPRADQYACAGDAQAESGENVGVVIQVDAQGRQLGSYALWAPAARFAQVTRDLSQPDIRLGIRFSGNSAQDIGKADLMRVQATAFSPLRKRLTTATLRKRLATFKLDFAFGDTSPQHIVLMPQDDAIALPGVASSYADLPLPVSWPSHVTIRLLDQKGAPVNSAIYGLSAVETRDLLYRQARDQAQSLTANPSACDPAGDMPGQPPFL